MSLKLMEKRVGAKRAEVYGNEWVVVKHYPEFIKYITKHGLPELISFDHDLADAHYHKNMQEGVLNYESDDFNSDDHNKTGYHCAQWLLKYCEDNELDVPTCLVHSQNPVGVQNIVALLKL